MSTEVQEVLYGERISLDGKATFEHVEVIQRLVDAVRELQAENVALTARVTALEVFHP